MATNVISQVEVEAPKAIDREKICPLLLRIFISNVRHNSTFDYNRGGVPANELQIYTWMDCTLKELMSLIKDVNADARVRGTEFDFAVVTPERFTPRYVMREIGVTINGQRGVDDSKTLEQCKFEVGDYVDVAIRLPRVGGGGGRGGYGGGRGGYGGDRGGREFGRDRNYMRDGGRFGDRFGRD